MTGTPTKCAVCNRDGFRQEDGRLPLGWRTFNNHLAHGPVCPVCWGPYVATKPDPKCNAMGTTDCGHNQRMAHYCGLEPGHAGPEDKAGLHKCSYPGCTYNWNYLADSGEQL